MHCRNGCDIITVRDFGGRMFLKDSSFFFSPYLRFAVVVWFAAAAFRLLQKQLDYGIIYAEDIKLWQKRWVDPEKKLIR